MNVGSRASARGASLLVWAARLLLLGAAAGTLAASLLITRDGERVPAGRSGGAAAAYACPMHPQVVASQPGDCPICRMALEPTKPSRSRTGESVTVPPEADAVAYEVRHAIRWPIARQMVAPAWLDGHGEGVALFHADELSLLAPGERGIFRSAARPGQQGEIDVLGERASSSGREQGAPSGDGAREVRFRLVRSMPGQTPGLVGTAQFAARTRTALVIPASAVLESPQGPYVFVASDDRRTFTKRAVTLGRFWRELAVVVTGVEEGEPVVAVRTFFVDAQRRLAAETGALEAVP